MRLFHVTTLALVVTGACQTTHPPEVTTETVTTTKITPAAAEIEATLDAYNPNKADLTANSIDSKVTIGGKPDIAKAVVTEPLVIPAGQRIKVKLPIRVEWTDAAAIKALAATGQPAPYNVTGAVHFAGKGAEIQTAFKITGTMTTGELAQAAGTAPAGSARH